MSEQSILLRKLASPLPDIPRWVETRSMLLSGRCELFGFDETGAPSFALGSLELELISAAGFPLKEALPEAITANTAEVEISENSKHVAEALPDWRITAARLHVLEGKPRLHKISDNVQLLAPSEIEAAARSERGVGGRLPLFAGRRRHCRRRAGIVLLCRFRDGEFVGYID
jgi:hypothetical protein